MKHLNEQTQAMADAISEASQRKGIQWTRVTWYSWSLAIIVFLLVLPGVTFYVGMQYQAMKDERRALAEHTTTVRHQERAFRAHYAPRRPAVCVDDVMVCPDGTYVGRVPPNCEFALCGAAQNGAGSVDALIQ